MNRVSKEHKKLVEKVTASISEAKKLKDQGLVYIGFDLDRHIKDLELISSVLREPAMIGKEHVVGFDTLNGKPHRLVTKYGEKYKYYALIDEETRIERLPVEEKDRASRKEMLDNAIQHFSDSLGSSGNMPSNLHKAINALISWACMVQNPTNVVESVRVV